MAGEAARAYEGDGLLAPGCHSGSATGSSNDEGATAATSPEVMGGRLWRVGESDGAAGFDEVGTREVPGSVAATQGQ